MKTLRSILCALAVALLPVAAKAQCANGTVAQFNGTQMVCSATLTAVSIVGATVTLDNTATAFTLGLVSTDGAMSANRTLTFNTNNGNRLITLSGDLNTGGPFITSGASSLTLTTTGVTNVTLPLSGTLAVIGNPLSQFAATTSAQFFGIISDETGGAGVVVGSSSPSIATPTFTTSHTSPLWIGGSGTTGTQATIQTTTGNGTTDALAIKGGNNGATTFATFSAAQFTSTANITFGSSAGTIGTSGATYTAINAPGGGGSFLTFGNATDPTMYINAATINFRTVASVSYTTVDTTSLSALQATAATSSTTGAIKSAGGIGAVGAIWAGTYVATGVVAVASLPACGAGIKGARMFVNDNNTALAFAAVITTGGAIQTPVYCDGTVWRQG